MRLMHQLTFGVVWKGQCLSLQTWPGDIDNSPCAPASGRCLDWSSGSPRHRGPAMAYERDGEALLAEAGDGAPRIPAHQLSMELPGSLPMDAGWSSQVLCP